MNEYVKSQIQNGNVLNIACPFVNWNWLINDETIETVLTSHREQKIIEKFKTFKEEIHEISLGTINTMFSQSIQLNHEHKLLKKKNLRKTIQQCPNCCSYVTRAKVCNHMNCIKCSLTFWMFCRKKYSKNHMNPLSKNACRFLARTKAVSKMPAVRSRSCLAMTCLLILFQVMSPVIACTTVPYILYKNMANDERFCMGATLALLSILMFPVTWIFTIVCIFVLYCQMLK